MVLVFGVASVDVEVNKIKRPSSVIRRLLPFLTSYMLFPLVSLAILLLAFGLLAPWLGFYFDDWPVITTLHLRSPGTFWDFYAGERPFSAWTYMLAGPLLGTRPIIWQYFSIFVRWLTVLGLWWTLQELWPARRRAATWTAMLFAVYPAFDQQAISVAYSQHWIIYALYFASTGAMLRAIRDPRRAGLWTGIGLAAQAVHLLSMEYFAGLELLRPLMLGFVAAETIPDRRGQVRYGFKRWLPYLAVLVGYVLWRLLVLPEGGLDPNRPSLLFGLFSQTTSTLIALAQFAVQDFLNIVFGSWHKTLEPAAYVLTDRTALFSLGAGLVGAAVTVLYLKGFREAGEQGSRGAGVRGRAVSGSHAERGNPERHALRGVTDEGLDAERPGWGSHAERGNQDSSTDLSGSQAERGNQERWLRQAFALGVLGILLGTLPVWLTDRQTTLGLYGSRFALAAMFGASLLTVAALEWMTVKRLARVVLLGALVGLAIGFHIRRANDFRWSWVKQSRFYWQLAWRAPDLKPGTAVGADGELFLYVGRYSTSLALNLLYPEALPYPHVGHWFYELTPELIRHPEEMVAGKPIQTVFRNFQFNGSTRDSVIVYYEPESGKCLWVLRPEDGDNPELPLLSIGGLPLSNLDQIEAEPGPQGGPPEDIFGPEPEHSWCYYFQKADLALQQGDWRGVAKLGDQAQNAGYSPNNPQEWIPFIQGYARAGRWKEAIQKTQQVYRVNFRVGPRLCRVWDELEVDHPPPAELQGEVQAMRDKLECEAEQ